MKKQDKTNIHKNRKITRITSQTINLEEKEKWMLQDAAVNHDENFKKEAKNVSMPSQKTIDETATLFKVLIRTYLCRKFDGNELRK